MSISAQTKRWIRFYLPDDPRYRYDRPASALAIEALALSDEQPRRLTALLQEYLDELRPATRSQLELVEQLTIATIEKQRLVRARTALLAGKVRTAGFRFDQAQEADVEKYVEMLPSNPTRALAGLDRTAAGTRYQVRRWERLHSILKAKGTWHGQARDEAALLLGARPGWDHVAASETAYVIRLYCLFAQDNPQESDVNELANPAHKPETFRDHDPDEWAPAPTVCCQLLDELAVRELARLRSRESWLRVNIEEPARTLAQEQARVLTGKELELLTAERHHDQMFHRAYKALNPRGTRSGRRFAAGRESPDLEMAPPLAFDTPLPSRERAAADVLDYDSAHRAVLETEELVAAGLHRWPKD